MQKVKFRDLFHLYRFQVIFYRLIAVFAFSKTPVGIENFENNLSTIRLKKSNGVPIITASLLFFFTLFFSHASTAQNARGNYNFLDFQQKPYYFGITLGFNRADYRIFNSKTFILNDSIQNVESVTGPGFNLGIVTNLKIGQYFDFRFLPTLSFAERTIEFTSAGTGRLLPRRKIESVFVEMPFHIRYKSAPYKDMRLFVIAGVKYGFDVASDSKTRQAGSLVKIAPTDFAGEVGVGVQFFFPYFIFSPELKMSYGLGNTLIFDQEIEESRVIEKILSRTFTLSLHFEG